MELNEAVKVLGKIPIFAKLEPAKLKLLAFASDYLTFENGETLFRAGERSDGVYLIDDGEAEVIVEEGGREIIVATHGKHKLIGEMAVIRNSSRAAMVRAKGTLKALRVNDDLFLKLVTQNPDTALRVMQLLCYNIVASMESYEKLEARLREAESRLKAT